MAGETYRYNVVIGVDVVTSGAASGEKDVEAVLTRTQRKVQEKTAQIQKHLDTINIDKISKTIAIVPDVTGKAVEAAASKTITASNNLIASVESTNKKIVNSTKLAVDQRLLEEQRFDKELETLGLRRIQNLATGKKYLKGGQVDSLNSATAKAARQSAQLHPQTAAGLQEVEQAAVGSGEAVAGLTTRLGAATIAAGLIVAAIAAVIVILAALAIGAYLLGQKMFALVKAFAEYVTQIDKVREATGLSIKTTSALVEAAREQGVEIGAIEKAMSNYRTTVGQAVGGNLEAAKSMKLLGIDASTAMSNIDGTTKQIIKTIVELPAGLEQSKAAFAAFGAEGYKLIPFFQSFHGNVDEAVAAAERLGLVLSDEDVKGAKAFNAEYAKLEGVLRGLKLMFGREFLPAVIDVITKISGFLVSNKDRIKEWAVWSGDWIEYIINKFKSLYQFTQDHPIITRLLAGTTTAGNLLYGLKDSGVGPDHNGGLSSQGQNFGMENYDPSKAFNNHSKSSTGNSKYDEIIYRQSLKYGVDANLIVAQMAQESSNRPGAISNKGASGLMQLMPATARRLGVTNIFDPEQNITGGVKYMSQLLRMFGGNTSLALAGYNAGEGAVQKYGNKIPPYKETQDYVKRIMGKYSAGGHADPAALDAYRDEQAKRDQEIIERNKRDWEAAIQSWQTYGQRAAQVLDKQYGDMQEALTRAGESGNIGKFKSDTDIIIANYQKQADAALNAQDALEKGKLKRNKTEGGPGVPTANEEKNILDAQLSRHIELNEKIKEQYKKRDYFVFDATKQRIAKELGDEKEKYRRIEDTSQQSFDFQQAVHSRALEKGQESEQTYLNWLKAAEYQILETRRTNLESYITALDKADKIVKDPTGERDKQRADTLHQIGQIQGQIDLKRFENQTRLTPLLQEEENLINSINKKRLENANIVDLAQRRYNKSLSEQRDLEYQISDIEDTIANLHDNDGLKYERARKQSILDIAQAEIDANLTIIQSNATLDDSRIVHMTQVQALLLRHLSEQETATQRTANVMIDIYDYASTSIGKALDKVGIGKIPVIGNLVKSTISGWLTNITRNLVDKVLPGLSGTLNNKPADPLLTETQGHTKLLTVIANNTARFGYTGTGMSSRTGLPGMLSAGSGSMGSFGLGSSFSGGGGAGIPPTGTIIGSGASSQYVVNGGGYNGGAGSYNPNLSSSISHSVAGNSQGQATAPAGGAKFSLGALNKAIFGKQGFGWNTGTMQGIGALAGVAGGAIGGNVGSVLSGVAGGIGMAASLASILGISALGGPIGLAIGAAVGGLVALGSILFGNAKQRRADEKTRDSLMVSSLSQLTKILGDVKSDKIDGSQAIDQANSIRSDYLDQAGQLKDKKTRNIALKDVNRLDVIIGQIKTAADSQKNRKDRLIQLVPTFAEGGSVQSYSGHGFVSGPGGPRDDVIPAMLSNKEYVLDAITTKNLGVRNLDMLRKTKGLGIQHMLKNLQHMKTPREYADGGYVYGGGSNLPMSSSSPGEKPNISVVNNIYHTPTETKVDTQIWLDTPEGKQKLIGVVEENIYRQGSNGPIPQAIKNVSK